MTIVYIPPPPAEKHKCKLPFAEEFPYKTIVRCNVCKKYYIKCSGFGLFTLHQWVPFDKFERKAKKIIERFEADESS